MMERWKNGMNKTAEGARCLFNIPVFRHSILLGCRQTQIVVVRFEGQFFRRRLLALRVLLALQSRTGSLLGS